MGQPVPNFTKEGLLPHGEYKATFGELRESILVEGPGPESVWSEEWDAEWREHLTRQSETMCTQLWQVGIEDIYLDGSFTEAKAHPNDIDGYFECDARRVATGELQRKLNQIDPRKCWTWDPEERRAYWGYAKKQLPMWHAYRIELYPHYDQFTGITDEHGNPPHIPGSLSQATPRRRAEGNREGRVAGMIWLSEAFGVPAHVT